MGFGVFATRDINTGELIFAERPMLVVPRAMKMGNTTELIERYGLHKAQLITMAGMEKALQVAVGRMSAEDQKEFMSLANNHQEDGSGPILGIIRTNGYGTYSLFDGPARDEEDTNVYSSILKIGSRINHSCRPNVVHNFSLTSFSYQFKAMVEIKAGEQLFYSYCSPKEPAAARQAQLAPYGVVCKCLSCANATRASNKFRAEFSERTMSLAQPLNWKGDQILYIDSLMQLRRGLTDEGLQGMDEYVICLQLICFFYKSTRQPLKEKIFLKEFNKHNELAQLPVL